MEKEDKELLIRDLCARVPYKIKVYLYEKETCFFLTGIDGNEVYLNLYLLPFRIESIKPYLRPLSSMTEEEKYELSGVNGVLDVDFEFETYKVVHLLKSHNVIDWFNKHHFDYRGLIEKGLALVAPDGMYNN